MKFTYKTNEEELALEKMLKDQGFKRTKDCYWCQIMKRGEETIRLVRK